MVKRKLKRNNFLSVRFSTEEKEQLKKLAATRHQTLSELVRTVTLERTDLSRQKIIPQVNRRLYFELGEVLERLQGASREPNAESAAHLQRILQQLRGTLLGMHSLQEHQID
ncbi:MAG: conjugal transfer protein [Xenococcaceae cyanobacterium]